MIFWINRYKPLKMLFIYRNFRKYHCSIVLLSVMVTVWSLSLLTFLDLFTISQHIFNTWFIPVIQFWYSSGSFSFMWVLKFIWACCLTEDISLLTVASPTWRVFAISDWVFPWLDNYNTLVLRHWICLSVFFVLRLSPSIPELKSSTFPFVFLRGLPFSRVDILKVHD